MESAFQVSSSEDAMAINLLRRAADAIVARSELAQNVRSLETETTYLKTQVDRLSSERNNMDETIRYLTAQLTEAKRKVDELEANNNRHVDRISVLETNLAMRDADLVSVRRERDEAQFDLLDEREQHAVTKAALSDAESKLAKIQSIFPSAVITPAVAVPEVTAESTFPADAQRPTGADLPGTDSASWDLPVDTPTPADRVPPQSIRSSDPIGVAPHSSAAEAEADLPSGSPAPTSQGVVEDEPVESHPWWDRPAPVTRSDPDDMPF